MSHLFWQFVKIAPAVLSASFFVSQGALAAPDGESNLQTTDSPTAQAAPESVANPQEALGILRNRPTLQDQLDKRFNHTPEPQSMSQVTSVSELRDVEPTEWAFEALRSLVERYGCIVGYPDRTYRGDRALTRWEFAAGLNACLNTIERLLQENVAVLREDIDKLKRLAEEFQQELAALGARVDNLEERVAFLEDHQFSTTTKLKGTTQFILGNAWGGRALDHREQDLFDQGIIDSPGIDDNAFLAYRVRLNLETSFTGKDLLRTRLQASSIPNLAQATGTDMARLTAESGPSDSDVILDDLWYRFPFGNLTTWVGANSLDIDDIFNTGNPFLNSSDTGALNRFLRYNPLTMRGPQGTGLGLSYKFADFFSLRGLYLAAGADAPDPSEGRGLFNGSFSAGAQLDFTIAESLDFQVTYLHSYYNPGGNISEGTGSFVDDSIRNQVSGRTRTALGRGITRDPFLNAATTRDSYGVQANWRISNTFNLSANGAYALATAQNRFASNGERLGADLWSWMASLSVIDLLKEGSVLSVSGGQMTRAARIDALNVPGNLTIPDQNASYIVEAQYKYPINDNILLTPAVYVILNPDNNNNNNSIWVGALRTTFRF